MSDELLLIPLLEDCDDLTIAVCLKNLDTEKIPISSSFNLELCNDKFCLEHFRFTKVDIYRLRRCLRIPIYMKLKNRLLVSGIEALCITLKRMAYPNRFVDLMKFFGRPQSVLSMIFNETIHLLIHNHGHLLRSVKHAFVNENTLRDFSEAISCKGSPYKMCIGFLDGTVRPICRPIINQREYYNGHKRTHAIKFQSVMLPNGIIAMMYGPVSGRRHDAHILAESGLLEQMETADFLNSEGKPYYVYGDPAYPLRKNLIVPFKGHTITNRKRIINSRMSSVRESVEWGFSKIIQIWAFLDYKKNLKIGMSAVANYYLVGTLLTNCHTCLYGGQVSSYFDCDPPTLEDYLRYN